MCALIIDFCTQFRRENLEMYRLRDQKISVHLEPEAKVKIRNSALFI